MRISGQAIIAEIAPADRQAMIDLHRHIRTVTDTPIYPEYAQANIDFRLYEKNWATYFDNKAAGKKDLALKATLDNRIIGFARFSTANPDDPKLLAIVKDGWAELHWLYILPEYQGQRIGKQLYQLAKKHAADWGCRQMVIEAYRDNPTTRKFYESFGLKIASEVLSHNIRSERAFDIPSVRFVEFNLG